MQKHTNLHDCFQSELQALTYSGKDIHSNGSNQTELLFRSVAIDDPRKLSIDHPSRKFNPAYSVLEFLWYLSAHRKTNNIGKCANIWLKIQDELNEVESNYGTYILGNQWDWIVNEFTSDEDSRRCTIVIHQPHHKTKNPNDLPCTQYLQFFIRENKLHLGVNMRSNDIIFGFCNDIFNFALFQQLMLNELRVIYPTLELGTYYHHAGSLHLYQTHNNMRDNILMDECFSEETIYELNPWITRKYIEDNSMTLPTEDMSKIDLMAFTNTQMKKLFI
jgi:thymidylate synthase